jgi:2-polyprenyl-3-methyl-5-hydroxy-6-metoxy-1,4-benzoquinol methylase
MYLTVDDHFLSHESFQLYTCDTCKLLFTHPRPSEEHISAYYKSDNYVSHSASNKGIINKLYLQVRKHTLKQKLNLLTSLSDNRTLLDIGAGTGHFLQTAKLAGFQVTGIEPDTDARQIALSEHHLKLQPQEYLYQIKETFDFVTMWHVLEHVYHLSTDLNIISSMLKSGGYFIVAVPNHTSFDATYYKEFWAAYDVPRHLYHFSPQSIVPLIENLGFDCVDIKPMKFDSYYVSMLSEKYKGGSILNAIRIGFLSNLKSKNYKSSSQIYIFKKK